MKLLTGIATGIPIGIILIVCFRKPGAVETSTDDMDIEESYRCRSCGEGIPRAEYPSGDGLCRMCLRMPLHRDFPSPPGFPKF